MKSEKTICPNCGAETAAVEALRADGWRMVRRRVCLFCGADLPESPVPAAETAAAKPCPNALSELLGAIPEAAPAIDPGDGAGRFCRRCGFCVIHPFRNFCTRRQIDVDPMGDCPEFKEKSES